MKRDALGKIESFLKHRLKTKLRNDLRLFRVTKEADVECCIYYHLRRTLPANGPWRVFARKYAKRTEHYIDLVVFKNKRPRIAIEVKWNTKQMPKKDRRSLNKALKPLRVNKAYFVSVGPNISKTSYRKLEKKPDEKHRLHEVYVGLDASGEHQEARIRQWKNERDLFGRKMIPGKAKRKST
jgi:predicted AAA+ superfamily ATPase